jgi:SAM-dependent methyltransferase
VRARLAMRIESLRSKVRRRLTRRRQPVVPAVALRDLADVPPVALPELVDLSVSKVLALDDFGRLAAWIDLAFPGARAGRPDFPRGREYRKHWEVAMALHALAREGHLRPDAEILGIAAGNEPTAFVLTNFVRRVFATDLYLAEGWGESASPVMLADPGRHHTGPWHPGRLVVQHMDALDLRYDDASFDATFSSGSIEHFGGHEQVRVAMQEAFRVLKPGGLCSVSTEFRLRGPGPGLPGVLMFSADELRDHVIGSAPWELVGELEIPSGDLPVVPYADALVDGRRHARRHGAVDFDRLEWSVYPHVALEHDGRVWTSCHLSLRKPTG